MTFKSHLENIRRAKSETDRIMEVWNPGHSAAEAALAVAWEALFDLLCSSPSTDLSDLNIISAIIHKLTSSYTQIKSLELRSKEAFSKSPIPQLTPETLASIEQQLHLL